MSGHFRVKRLELNMPQRSDFRPIEVFFSLTYASMPSEKKHSAESKLRPFRCFAVLKEQIFVTARRKSARNTRLFQRFSTMMWQKYAFQNRMEFDSFHSKICSVLSRLWSAIKSLILYYFIDLLRYSRVSELIIFFTEVIPWHAETDFLPSSWQSP